MSTRSEIRLLFLQMDNQLRSGCSITYTFIERRTLVRQLLLNETVYHPLLKETDDNLYAPVCACVWSQPNSRWLTQLVDFRHRKIGYNSDNFTDIQLRFYDIVDESHSQHNLWVLPAWAQNREITYVVYKLCSHFSVSDNLGLKFRHKRQLTKWNLSRNAPPLILHKK